MPEVPVPDTLAGALDRAAGLLSAGARDRRGAAHAPTLATIGLDGRPRLRTVVLRALDMDARTLRFHADARGDKVAEMAADPRVALHVYDAGEKLQVRVEGRATLHRDGAVADEAWAGSRRISRVCYATQPAPGAVIAAGDAYRLPEEGEVEAGRANFVAVTVRIGSIETLSLAFAGHRRALFRFDPDEALWLVP